MSVKLLDNDAFYGYRVRRTVAGQLHQEYLSLKAGGKRINGKAKTEILAQAEERDAELAELQAKHKLAEREQRCFDAKGRIRGISYLKKQEKSGTVTPIFQVGISSELEGKTICTSFSVNAHGEEGAWLKAVDTYARHKKISKRSKFYKKLLAARPKRPKR